MRRKLITTKPLFFISLIVIVLTILLVYISGLENYRSLYLNSLYSLSILSGTFFLFITLGLYNNFKVKDSLGKILYRDKIEVIKKPNIGDGNFDLSGMPAIGEDPITAIVGLLFGIILWLIFSFIISWFIWATGIAIWAVILAIFAMLYWIFFRALRMVFKMAPVCKDNLLKSMGYGLFYTVLYNCWIYGIIFSLHFLVK